LSDLAAPLTTGADLTPDQKVLLVLTERKNGPVTMVGDGVNDPPALLRTVNRGFGNGPIGVAVHWVKA